MKQRVIFCLIISVLIANNESLKVVYSRNTSVVNFKAGNIIKTPPNCKEGFIYAPVHRVCRKIAE